MSALQKALSLLLAFAVMVIAACSNQAAVPTAATEIVETSTVVSTQTIAPTTLVATPVPAMWPDLPEVGFNAGGQIVPTWGEGEWPKKVYLASSYSVYALLHCLGQEPVETFVTLSPTKDVDAPPTNLILLEKTRCGDGTLLIVYGSNVSFGIKWHVNSLGQLFIDSAVDISAYKFQADPLTGMTEVEVLVSPYP